MTALTVEQSVSAVAPGISGASFLGVGGTPPYAYAVASNGAGGTVDPTSGVYSAPLSTSGSIASLYDTIVVTDAASNTASAQILVGTPLHLLADIIQHELGLAQGRCFLWNQKAFKPTDAGIYVVVAMQKPRVFANCAAPQSVTNGGLNNQQALSLVARVTIDIMSRGIDAFMRKDEIPLALASTYSLQQQAANGFALGTLPLDILDLSEVDGAAIPYRFRITINMQYTFSKIVSVPYFDTFENQVYVDYDPNAVSDSIIDAGTPSDIPDNVLDGGDPFTR